MKLWNEIGKHINNDYAVTGWTLCVILHIIEDAFKNSNGKHHNQVNNVIKNFHSGLTEKELNATLDTFWSEYKKFNH